jgi:hypothetical protein
MGDEPPLEQYILHVGKWTPLVDGFYLMDMIIDGNPEISGPVLDPPEGVPPYEPIAPSPDNVGQDQLCHTAVTVGPSQHDIT